MGRSKPGSETPTALLAMAGNKRFHRNRATADTSMARQPTRRAFRPGKQQVNLSQALRRSHLSLVTCYYPLKDACHPRVAGRRRPTLASDRPRSGHCGLLTATGGLVGCRFGAFVHSSRRDLSSATSSRRNRRSLRRCALSHGARSNSQSATRQFAEIAECRTSNERAYVDSLSRLKYPIQLAECRVLT